MLLLSVYTMQQFVDIVELMLFLWPAVYFFKFQIQTGYGFIKAYCKQRSHAKRTEFWKKQHVIVNRGEQGHTAVEMGSAADPSKRAMARFTNELDDIAKRAVHAVTKDPAPARSGAL